jgi:hypothetical protein
MDQPTTEFSILALVLRASGRYQRSDRAADRTLGDRRLPDRRHRHRSVRTRVLPHAGLDPERGRAWYRHAAVCGSDWRSNSASSSRRRAIALLGAAQLALTRLAIAGLAVWLGLLSRRRGLVALALAMSATAIAPQILEERGEPQQTHGQRAFAILLSQDMAVVPLLALLPRLGQAGEGQQGGSRRCGRSA